MLLETEAGIKANNAECPVGIRLADIPDIDLYLDQITTIFGGKMPGYSDNPLTKAMINNYSRENLIRNVKGKKYTREQIIQMLIIYRLKQALGMQEIRRLFDFLEAAGISYEKCFSILLEEEVFAINDHRQVNYDPEPIRRIPGYESLRRQLSENGEELLRNFLFCALMSMEYKHEAEAGLKEMTGSGFNKSE